MRDGKLSSKAMFDREGLLKIQDDLPKYMREARLWNWARSK